MTDLKTPYGTRLCLSGMESRRLFDTFTDFGVKHIQVSYYYLRRVFSDPDEFASLCSPFSTVLIDSGTVYHKFKNPDEEKSFLGEYAAYIGALNNRGAVYKGGVYTAAVYEGGVSMESIVPEEALIYPIDHIRGTFDNDLDALCRNIPYIGVSNKEAAKKGGEALIPILASAKKHNTKVHLFATSSRRILTKFPIYSANTSSWRSGSRYLNTYIYEGPSRGHKLHQPTDKSDTVKTERELKILRGRQRNMVKVRQPHIYDLINWEEVDNGDSWEVDKANLSQWLMYIEDQSLSPHNKYWLSEDEKQEIITRKQVLLGNSPYQASRGKGGHDEAAPRESADNNPPNNQSGDIQESGDIIGEYIGGQDIDPPNNAEDTYIEGEVEEVGREEKDIDIPVPLSEDPPLASTLGKGDDNNRSIVRKNALDSLSIGAGGHEKKRITPIDDRMRTVRQCDFCILQGRCPKYQPGAACAYGLPPENPTYDHTNLEKHVMEDMADLLAIQKDRILQAYLEEKMDAAGISGALGKEMQRYVEMVELLSEATDKRDSISIQAKGTGIMDMFKK